MRSKAFGLLLMAAVFGTAASAQSTGGQIEKALKDPKRKENEAKADRRLQNQDRTIIDATSATQATNRKKKKPAKQKS